ncbi:MAG: GNAT family N-acetyltransferase [Chloroflexi bacterium]|nr:GNAT family N-acetyltransferase [Chloroflexota bacterium]
MAASEEIQVRPAIEDDATSIMRLYDDIDQLHTREMPHIFRETNGSTRSASWLRVNLEHPNYLMLVAEQTGTIVGMVEGHFHRVPSSPMYHQRALVMVDTLVVSAAHQRQGIGRLLMEELESWARRSGARDVQLMVWDFNEAAKQFYASLGYHPMYQRLNKPLDDANSKS